MTRLFETIHSRDHAWSFHRQFFWSSNLTFDEWRMLILDYRVMYVYSRSVERRMFILDLSSDVYDETSLNLTRHLIKFVVSDSLNLTKAIHQIWWMKTFSYQMTKAIHQTWRKQRHLIKSNQRVILSNFWKDRQSLYFMMSNLLQWHLM